jgi:hypothetical protein
MQRRDQLVCLLVGQWTKVEYLDRPVRGKPRIRPCGHHDQQPLACGAQERTEYVHCGWIEPVHILSDHQPRAVPETGEQIAPHRISDCRIKLMGPQGDRHQVRPAASVQSDRVAGFNPVDCDIAAGVHHIDVHRANHLN